MSRILIFLYISLWISPQLLNSQDKLQIVASASMIADITENIVGDLHHVQMIVPIGGDPHLHEPTPSDARMVAMADLIIINGLTFEGWINELIENSGTEAEVITVTEGVEILRSQTYQNSVDPHAWMDASNGIIYAKNIGKALIEIDPRNREYYSKNLEEYTSQLLKLDSEIEAAIMTIPEQQRVLITSHDAFQYYGKRYGIRLEAIMGISTEAEAQTSDIIRVNNVISEKNVPAIFIESTINPKLIEQLASDNNVSIGGKLYADSLGDDKSPASTYIKMLRHNTTTIVNALTMKYTPENEIHKTKSNFTFLFSLGVFLFAGLGLAIYILNR